MAKLNKNTKTSLRTTTVPSRHNSQQNPTNPSTHRKPHRLHLFILALTVISSLVLHFSPDLQMRVFGLSRRGYQGLASRVGRARVYSSGGSVDGTTATTTPTTTTSAAEDTSTSTSTSTETDSKPDPPQKGLPAPPPKDSKQLNVGSDEGIRFDHLGPIVVNKDGSMSRITNWDAMAPIERENTLRILKKRNRARLDALREKEKTKDDSA